MVFIVGPVIICTLEKPYGLGNPTAMSEKCKLIFGFYYNISLIDVKARNDTYAIDDFPGIARVLMFRLA